jgi:membrane protein
MGPRQAFELLKQTAIDWQKDQVPQIGAALAYYTTISMAPLLVIVVGVAGLLFDKAEASEQIVGQLTTLIGPTGAEAVSEILENSSGGKQGLLPTILGAVTLFLGSTTVFAQIQAALNAIWDAEPPKRAGWLTMVRLRFLSFAMVLVTGFLLLVSLVLSAALSSLGSYFGTLLPLPEVALQALNTLISIGVVATLFALLYKFLPDVDIQWGDVWIGALFTSVLFNVGKLAIGLYLGNSSVGSAYGAAGSLVVMLVWIYYSAQIVLFGAEFTQVYARSHGSMKGSREPTPVLELAGV